MICQMPGCCWSCCYITGTNFARWSNKILKPSNWQH